MQVQYVTTYPISTLSQDAKFKREQLGKHPGLQKSLATRQAFHAGFELKTQDGIMLHVLV